MAKNRLVKNKKTGQFGVYNPFNDTVTPITSDMSLVRNTRGQYGFKKGNEIFTIDEMPESVNLEETFKKKVDTVSSSATSSTDSTSDFFKPVGVEAADTKEPKKRIEAKQAAKQEESQRYIDIFGLTRLDYSGLQNFGSLGEVVADVLDVPANLSKAFVRGVSNGRINQAIMDYAKDGETMDSDLIARLIKENKTKTGSTYLKTLQEKGVLQTEDLSAAGGIAETIMESMGSMLGAVKAGFQGAVVGGSTGLATGAAATSIGGPVGAALGAVGGATGGAVSGFAGFTSYANEYGSTIVQALTEKGYDLTDKNSVEKGLKDKSVMDAAKEKANTRGLTVGAFDAITAGLAGKGAKLAVNIARGSAAKVGKELTKAGVKRIAGATALGIESTMGSVGEAMGQLATEGKITDYDAVALEGIAEIGNAGPSTAFAMYKSGQINSDLNQENQAKIESLKKAKEAIPADNEASLNAIDNKISALEKENKNRNKAMTSALQVAPVPATKRVIELTDSILELEATLEAIKDGSRTDVSQEAKKAMWDSLNDMIAERDEIRQEMLKASETEAKLAAAPEKPMIPVVNIKPVGQQAKEGEVLPSPVPQNNATQLAKNTPLEVKKVEEPVMFSTKFDDEKSLKQGTAYKVSQGENNFGTIIEHDNNGEKEFVLAETGKKYSSLDDAKFALQEKLTGERVSEMDRVGIDRIKVEGNLANKPIFIGDPANNNQLDMESKGAIQKAVRALRSVSNANVYLYGNAADYAKGIAHATGQTANDVANQAGKSNAQVVDANGENSIHINLEKADVTSLSHEVFHGALLGLAKKDPNAFVTMRDKILDRISEKQSLMVTNPDGTKAKVSAKEYLLDFQKRYSGSEYTEADRAEEFLSELAGLMSLEDNNVVKDKTLLESIKLTIKDVLKKFNVEFDSLNELQETEDLVQFFKDFNRSVKTGESINLSRVQGIQGAAPITPTPAQQQTSTTDAKADIERRRQEELTEFNAFVKQEDGRRQKPLDEDFIKDTISKVNAKYDAELAALESKATSTATQPTAQAAPTTTQPVKTSPKGTVTKFSILGEDNRFRPENANPKDNNVYYGVDEEGDVFMLAPESKLPRMIYDFKPYIGRLYDIAVPKGMRMAEGKGVLITELPKVDSQGNLVKKGKLTYTDSPTIKYDIKPEATVEDTATQPAAQAQPTVELKTLNNGVKESKPIRNKDGAKTSYMKLSVLKNGDTVIQPLYKEPNSNNYVKIGALNSINFGVIAGYYGMTAYDFDTDYGVNIKNIIDNQNSKIESKNKEKGAQVIGAGIMAEIIKADGTKQVHIQFTVSNNTQEKKGDIAYKVDEFIDVPKLRYANEFGITTATQPTAQVQPSIPATKFKETKSGGQESELVPLLTIKREENFKLSDEVIYGKTKIDKKGNATTEFYTKFGEDKIPVSGKTIYYDNENNKFNQYRKGKTGRNGEGGRSLSDFEEDYGIPFDEVLKGLGIKLKKDQEVLNFRVDKESIEINPVKGEMKKVHGKVSIVKKGTNGMESDDTYISYYTPKLKYTDAITGISTAQPEAGAVKESVTTRPEGAKKKESLAKVISRAADKAQESVKKTKGNRKPISERVAKVDGIIGQALRIEPASAYDLALQYFIGGGRVLRGKVTNGSKPDPHTLITLFTRPRQGYYVASEKEMASRGFLTKKDGLLITEIAHKLWESQANEYLGLEESEMRSAVEAVLLDHTTTSSMAKDIISRHGNPEQRALISGANDMPGLSEYEMFVAGQIANEFGVSVEEVIENPEKFVRKDELQDMQEDMLTAFQILDELQDDEAIKEYLGISAPEDLFLDELVAEAAKPEKTLQEKKANLEKQIKAKKKELAAANKTKKEMGGIGQTSLVEGVQTTIVAPDTMKLYEKIRNLKGEIEDLNSQLEKVESAIEFKERKTIDAFADVVEQKADEAMPAGKPSEDLNEQEQDGLLKNPDGTATTFFMVTKRYDGVYELQDTDFFDRERNNDLGFSVANVTLKNFKRIEYGKVLFNVIDDSKLAELITQAKKSGSDGIVAITPEGKVKEVYVFDKANIHKANMGVSAIEKQYTNLSGSESISDLQVMLYESNLELESATDEKSKKILNRNIVIYEKALNAAKENDYVSIDGGKFNKEQIRIADSNINSSDLEDRLEDIQEEYNDITEKIEEHENALIFDKDRKGKSYAKQKEELLQLVKKRAELELEAENTVKALTLRGNRKSGKATTKSQLSGARVTPFEKADPTYKYQLSGTEASLKLIDEVRKKYNMQHTAEEMGIVKKGMRATEGIISNNIVTRVLSRGSVAVNKMFSNDKANKLLGKPFAGLQNYIANNVRKGLGSQNAAAANASAIAVSLIQNLGSTEGFQSARNKLSGGKSVAKNQLWQLGKELNEMINNDKVALRRVHSLLDPEAFEDITDPTLPDSKADLSFAELRLFNVLRDMNDFIHEWHYRNGFLGTGEQADALYEKNKGSYFARMYNEIETERFGELYDALAKLPNAADFSMFKERKNFLDVTENLTLKEDPIYITTKRFGQMMQNQAILEFCDYVAKSKDYKIYKNKEDIPASAVSNYRLLAPKKGGGKVYGPLTGKYVPDIVAQQLQGIEFSNQAINLTYQAAKIFDKTFARQVLSKMKTVWNPLTRAGNITMNFVFASLAGVDPITLLKNRPAAKESLESYDSYARDLDANGLLGVSMGKELNEEKDKNAKIVLRDAANRLLKREGKATSEVELPASEKSKFRKIASDLDDMLTESYGKSDDVAKVALYKSLVDDYGKTREEAIKIVAGSMQNYNTVGKAYDYASKTVNRFVKFKADSARILYNSFKDRPLNLMATLGMYLAAQALASKISGEDEEERKIREERPYTNKIKIGPVTISLTMKFGDTEVNVARYLAPYSVYDAGYDSNWLKDASTYLPLQYDEHTFIAVNDPLIGPIVNLAADKDFRGMPISDPGKTPFIEKTVTDGEAFWNRVAFAGRNFGAPYYGWGENLIAAATGDKDYYGRSRSMSEAILNTVIKVQTVNNETLQKSYEGALRKLDRDIDNIGKTISHKANEKAENISEEASKEGMTDARLEKYIANQERIFMKFYEEQQKEGDKKIMELQRVQGVLGKLQEIKDRKK